MDKYDLKRTIESRQNQLRETVVETVRNMGNNTKQNIRQLTELRDAFRDENHIGLINNSPVLNVYSITDYSSTFTGENVELLLQAVKTVYPEVTTIQYSLFYGKRSDLYLLSATPEELAQLAQIKEQEEKEYKEQERQEEQQEINVALVRSRIPDSRWDEYTFESFSVVDIDKNHSNKEASRLARQFTRIDCHSEEDTERIQEGWANFLTFIGTPGSGKTRLALTIGLYLIRHDAESVRYWQVQDLFETLKGTFNKSQKRHNSYDGNDDEIDDSYNKILESIKGCETLILDDLGAENGTEWVRSILDMLVDYRYENKMNTIITSNVSDVSELSPRIASRLSEGNICKILMPDFRKIKAVQREKKSRKVTNG